MIKFKKKDTVKDKHRKNWNILIVDDEKSNITITKSVLNKFEFDNKGLNFISAYNGVEAIEKLIKYDDIAIILLDIIMETDDAGLMVVKKIRNDLKNSKVRIILRTGQPGLAPEKDIILDYDINDYKEKTELTSVKLFSSLVTAIRSYKDINTIEQMNKEIVNTQKMGDIIASLI